MCVESFVSGACDGANLGIAASGDICCDSFGAGAYLDTTTGMCVQCPGENMFYTLAVFVHIIIYLLHIHFCSPYCTDTNVIQYTFIKSIIDKQQRNITPVCITLILYKGIQTGT